MNKSKIKRILHITGPMNRAGTETMLMNIYRNIDKDIVQFDFISYGDESAHYDEEIERLGGRIIRLSHPSQIGMKKSKLEIIRAINQYGPYEAIHAHTLFNSGIAMIAGKQCGIKIRIVHAHTTLDNNSSIIRGLYIYGMRLLINKFSTNTLACSKEAGCYLFGKKEIHKLKYQYFPNLVNYEDLLYKDEKKVRNFKEEYNLFNSMIIGHIGTFKESKNHKFLLEITKYMKEQNIDVKLLLVGDGELRKEIENNAKEFGIYNEVRFLGIREDIATILHSMDVFVFPSTFEGLGLVLLEAQASGVPCIVSEAIQEEADLDLNLFTKIKISEGVSSWTKGISKVAGKKENDLIIIKNAFNEKEYSTSKCISKLMRVYNIEYNKKMPLC